MTTSLFIPLPARQESAISLLYRYAKGNGFKTLSLLSARVGGLNLRYMQSIPQINSRPHRLLTAHPLLSAAEVADISTCFYKPIFYGKRLHIELSGVRFPATVLRNNLALCPACVRDGYLQRLHVFNFSDVCPVHAEYYIQRCPECQHTIEWTKIHDFACSCGYNFRNCPPNVSSNYVSGLLNRALDRKDQGFFELLLASIQAMSFYHAQKKRQEIIKTCVNIASGTKESFFKEMQEMQDLFPSLHRRALLAPFILSENITLSAYAQEFYYYSSQTRPSSHQAQCGCGQLSYSATELGLICTSPAHAAALCSSESCKEQAATDTSAYCISSYQHDSLCRYLYNSPLISWENIDEPAVPHPDFKMLTAEAAAQCINTTPSTVRRLIKTGLLRGYATTEKYLNGTTMDSLINFNRIYVLKTEIANRSGLNTSELNELFTNLIPMIIPTSRFSRQLYVYQRKHLTEDLRATMDFRSVEIVNNKPSLSDYLTMENVAQRLNIDQKNLRGLLGLGILKTTIRKGLRKSAEPFPHCTEDSIKEALSWRASHLTVQEIAQSAGCTSHKIQWQFIRTNFVPFILLKDTFVSKSDAFRIYRHLEIYTTMDILRRESGLSLGVLLKLVKQRQLLHLADGHPDAIPGRVIFERAHATSVTTLFIANNPESAYKRIRA
jgi:hypothetical protein